jgi:hypothetical protein
VRVASGPRDVHAAVATLVVISVVVDGRYPVCSVVEPLGMWIVEVAEGRGPAVLPVKVCNLRVNSSTRCAALALAL